MKKLAKEIVDRWKKLKEACEFYNPQYYRGHPELTDEWCGRPNSPIYHMPHCSMDGCPKLKGR